MVERIAESILIAHGDEHIAQAISMPRNFHSVATLGHLGRGIAVVLAFLQITGASGLYPIEMTPDFFQLIHPLLPITYGVDALRETIGGFYGTFYWKSVGVLGFMALMAYVVGVLLKRGLANVMRLVNEQLDGGELIVSDRVEVAGHGYRLRDVLILSLIHI